MKMNKVEGQDKGKVKLFALSTCVWCKRTRKLLDDLKVAYEYLYVDLLNEDEKQRAMEEIKKWNPACSFPTMVVNEDKCIIGFKPEQIREKLKV